MKPWVPVAKLSAASLLIAVFFGLLVYLAVQTLQEEHRALHPYERPVLPQEERASAVVLKILDIIDSQRFEGLDAEIEAARRKGIVPGSVMEYLDDFMRYWQEHQTARRNAALIRVLAERLLGNAPALAQWLKADIPQYAYRYAAVVPYWCIRAHEQYGRENFALYESYLHGLIEPSGQLTERDADILCLYARDFFYMSGKRNGDLKRLAEEVRRLQSEYRLYLGDGGLFLKQRAYLDSVAQYCTERQNHWFGWTLFNLFPEYWF